jgi:hypothetical protein
MVAAVPRTTWCAQLKKSTNTQPTAVSACRALLGVLLPTTAHAKAHDLPAHCTLHSTTYACVRYADDQMLADGPA